LQPLSVHENISLQPSTGFSVCSSFPAYVSLSGFSHVTNLTNITVLKDHTKNIAMGDLFGKWEVLRRWLVERGAC
jgi:hypothetical protein